MAHRCPNFDTLPIKYQDETKKLKENLRTATSLSKKRILFKEFTKNFTMLPALWNRWLGIEREAAESTYEKCKFQRLFNLEQKAFNDFYYHKFMERKSPKKLTTADFWFYKNIETFRNCYDLMFTVITESPKESEKLAEMFLSFPHRLIDNVFKVYQQVSVEPVPKYVKGKYEFNKNLYQKIMAVNDSDEEWLKLIKSVNDFEFFRQNIETRIAENPANKYLWKYYIEYLKEDPENFQFLLSVYYRYCRLFIDDEEMKAEFEEAELKEKRAEPEILEVLTYHGIRDFQKL
uniref:Uncharacterized protein n=1 Tax=Panagrolaimus sp. ES5 TaxID=591445 RepID=A0AC34G2L1_9BILA